MALMEFDKQLENLSDFTVLLLSLVFILLALEYVRYRILTPQLTRAISNIEHILDTVSLMSHQQWLPV